MHKINRIIYTLLMLLITSTALSNDIFKPENVIISIEHGVEVHNKRPGFRLTIENWIPKEKIIIVAISPSGERIELDNGSVFSDENGLCVLGLDYEVKGFYQGDWVLVVAGKAGFHHATFKLPTVTPNKNRVVNFGNGT